MGRRGQQGLRMYSCTKQSKLLPSNTSVHFVCILYRICFISKMIRAIFGIKWAINEQESKVIIYS